MIIDILLYPKQFELKIKNYLSYVFAGYFPANGKTC